jgi:hypothetical protein
MTCSHLRYPLRGRARTPREALPFTELLRLSNTSLQNDRYPLFYPVGSNIFFVRIRSAWLLLSPLTASIGHFISTVFQKAHLAILLPEPFYLLWAVTFRLGRRGRILSGVNYLPLKNFILAGLGPSSTSIASLCAGPHHRSRTNRARLEYAEPRIDSVNRPAMTKSILSTLYSARRDGQSVRIVQDRIRANLSTSLFGHSWNLRIARIRTSQRVSAASMRSCFSVSLA